MCKRIKQSCVFITIQINLFWNFIGINKQASPKTTTSFRKDIFSKNICIYIWKEFNKLLFNNFYWAFDCKQSLSKYLKWQRERINFENKKNNNFHKWIMSIWYWGVYMLVRTSNLFIYFKNLTPHRRMIRVLGKS